MIVTSIQQETFKTFNKKRDYDRLPARPRIDGAEIDLDDVVFE